MLVNISVYRVIHIGIYHHRIRTTHHKGNVSNGPRAELMAELMALASSRCAYQRRVVKNDVLGSGFVRNTAVELFQRVAEAEGQLRIV